MRLSHAPKALLPPTEVKRAVTSLGQRVAEQEVRTVPELC